MQTPPVQQVYQTVFTGQADQIVANSAAELSLLPGAARTFDGGLTLAPTSVWKGATVTGVIRGLYSTRTLLPGSCLIRLKLGSTTVATATLDALAVSLSQKVMAINFTMTFRTVGAVGSVAAAGQVQLAGASRVPQLYELTAPTDVAVDTTQPQRVDVTAQWATADSANMLSTRTAVLQKLMA